MLTRSTPRFGPLMAVVLMAALVAVGGLVGVAPAHATSDTATIDGIDYSADSDAPSEGATITDYDRDQADGDPGVVDIPDTIEIEGTQYPVTTIADHAFDSKGLTEVTIPESVTTFGYAAFWYNDLTELEIRDSVETIGEYVFAHNQLAELTIPESVKTIESGAFEENLLGVLTIPDSVETIASQAFKNNRLEEVVFGDSVDEIGSWAFGDNELTEVTIPGSVTSIGNWTFILNPLTEVRFTGQAPTTITEADQLSPSLGDEPGLTVYYPFEYEAGGDYPDGYTTPIWKGYDAQPEAIEHAVVFHPGDGEPTTTVTVEHGNTVTEPEDEPTRDGHEFTGWYVDADATSEYDFETEVTDDLNLYAGWQEVEEPVDPVPPTVTTDALPDGTVGEEYAFAVEAVGDEPLVFSATGLPEGLGIGAATGEIEGVPDSDGSFEVIVTVENDAGSASESYTMEIAAEDEPADPTPDPDPTPEPGESPDHGGSGHGGPNEGGSDHGGPSDRGSGNDGSGHGVSHGRGSGLAATGSSVSPLVAGWAVLLIAVGASMVVLERRHV